MPFGDGFQVIRWGRGGIQGRYDKSRKRPDWINERKRNTSGGLRELSWNKTVIRYALLGTRILNVTIRGEGIPAQAG